MYTLSLFFLVAWSTKDYCQRGQSCWPTPDEVETLIASLDPDAKRELIWEKNDKDPNPRVSSVPIGSPNDQPIYGYGNNGLDAVYWDGPDNTEDFTKNPCFKNSLSEIAGETRGICFAAIRNNPIQYTPGFVVWALTAEHVQTAVKFAVAHNLCVMVAGSAHDFVNRHSCPDGVFIRTTLMQSVEWDLDDSKGFGWADGTVRFGPGMVFSMAHKLAAEKGRFVASGWAATVGIAGWSVGGGHGPFGNAAGLGVDNVMEVDIVTADGSLITANANQNADLFRALRGGGGSTWGVITSFTLRAHKVPEDGITFVRLGWGGGDFCSSDRKKLDTFIDSYLNWTYDLSPKWSGLMFLTAEQKNLQFWNCFAEWGVFLQYVYLGSKEDAQIDLARLTANATWDGIGPSIITFENVPDYWQVVKTYGLEPISPIMNMPEGFASVLASRDSVADGTLKANLMKAMDNCKNDGACDTMQFYNCITGAQGATQDPNVSISPGLRKGLYHLVVPGNMGSGVLENFYDMYPNSYQAEASMAIPGDEWKNRYWGEETYARLLAVKKKYDPNNVFWCTHCVGSDLGNDKALPEEKSLEAWPKCFTSEDQCYLAKFNNPGAPGCCDPDYECVYFNDNYGRCLDYKSVAMSKRLNMS